MGALVENIGSGEFVTFDGIGFDLSYYGSGPALRTRASAGSVMLHDRTFVGVNQDFYSGLAHPGVRFEDPNVMAAGCTFTGA